MTKPVTSIAAMILYERGAFRLDDDVSRDIPQLAKLKVERDDTLVPLEKPITYRDLLRHTSGIYGYDGSFHEEGTWKEVMELKSLKELIDLLEKIPLRHQPGERYTYGLSTAVLGRVVEVHSGMSLAMFFEKEVFAPLGMTETSFSMTPVQRKRFRPLFVKDDGEFRIGTAKEDELYYRPEGSLFLGGEGLVSTIGDYGKFCQMLTSGGKTPGGRKLVKESTLAMMASDQLKGIPGFEMEEEKYVQGFGFWKLLNANKSGSGAPPGIFGWGGYHTTHFWIDPKNSLYAIFMTRLYPYNDTTERRIRGAVYQALGNGEGTNSPK